MRDYLRGMKQHVVSIYSLEHFVDVLNISCLMDMYLNPSKKNPSNIWMFGTNEDNKISFSILPSLESTQLTWNESEYFSGEFRVAVLEGMPLFVYFYWVTRKEIWKCPVHNIGHFVLVFLGNLQYSNQSCVNVAVDDVSASRWVGSHGAVSQSFWRHNSKILLITKILCTPQKNSDNLIPNQRNTPLICCKRNILNQWMYISVDLKTSLILTHWGLVTPYGDIDLG